jgi:glycosyltransferase involved in cell wall biosynthesis
VPTADVTVVMPAFNRADMIGTALDSIATQTVSPREVIVVDDASTDDTVAIARDRGVTVLTSEVNQGSGPARNRAIRAATTEWIAFLDSDDVWLEHHLEHVLQAAPGNVLVTAPGTTSRGEYIGNPMQRNQVLTPLALVAPGELVVTSGTIVRRTVLEQAGLFRPFRRGQDLDMWLRVLELGPGVALARPTFTYTRHPGQAILDGDLMRECSQAILDAFAKRPTSGRHDGDAAYVRINWDRARRHLRDGETLAGVQQLTWFLPRPHCIPILFKVLRQRRRRRALAQQTSQSTTNQLEPQTGTR